MSINWLILFPVDGDLRAPTYGLYGGRNYSGGVLLEPGDTPSFTAEPIDPLDELFRRHDQDVREAASPLEVAEADFTLIEGILNLPEDAVSGEGDLYAGAAILVMLSRILAVNPPPELLERIDFAEATDAALNLIEQGSLQPDPQEVAGLVSWLQQVADTLGEHDEPLLNLAAARILDLAGTLSDTDLPAFSFGLSDNALAFSVEEAKTLVVEAAESIAEWNPEGLAQALIAEHVTAVVQSQLLDTLPRKLELHIHQDDFAL